MKFEIRYWFASQINNTTAGCEDYGFYELLSQLDKIKKEIKK